MHVCVLCLEGTGLGMVIPEVPPGSTEPVPPELPGLGFRGACVGRRVCACLVRALVCTVGVFLLQTVPLDLRPGEGRGASPELPLHQEEPLCQESVVCKNADGCHLSVGSLYSQHC